MNVRNYAVVMGCIMDVIRENCVLVSGVLKASKRPGFSCFGVGSPLHFWQIVDVSLHRYFT